jgi:sigma-B regulation protein RsbU (phosphoserine phosphatase)
VAIPLRIRDRVVGALALESEREHFFTPHHVETLQLLGSQLAAAIETARLHQRVVRSSAALKADLAAARRIQQELLLSSAPACQGLELVAYNQPARAVSGDFYDFYPSAKGPVGILLGDVSGKGAPAALYGALVLGLFRSVEGGEQLPAGLLQAVNQALTRRRHEPSTFAAATFAKWLPASGELIVANSGAPRPLVLRRGSGRYLDVIGVPLGMFPGTEYEEVRVPLEAGDAVVFASDGVLESESSSGEEFGADRLAEVVCNRSASSPQELLDAVVTALGRHTGHVAPLDDQTLVIMRVASAT